MSPRAWEFRLDDIKQAIGDIELFVKGLSKDQFLSDKKVIIRFNGG